MISQTTKKPNLLLFLLLTIIAGSFFTSCNKRNNDLVEKTDYVSIADAQEFIERQRGLNSNIQNQFRSAQLTKLDKSIDWSAFKEVKTSIGTFSYAPLSNVGLTITPQFEMKRYIVFHRNNNLLSGQIIELIDPSGKKIDSKLENRLFSHLRISNWNDYYIPDNNDVKVLEYDLFYRRKLTKHISAAQAKMSIPSRVLALHKTTGPARTTSGCQRWGVYLVTYNDLGYEIDRQLLYTYLVGTCVQEAVTVILPDGGGGGNPYGGEPYDEDFDQSTYIETPDFVAFEQGYRSSMSQEELEIFDDMSLVQQTRYLHNAYRAKNLAAQYFPNSVNNGNGDAFRHALFNAMNAKVLGVDLAKRLGDAHENTPLQHPLSRQMDLFNNQVGRTLFQTLQSQGLAGSSFRENAILQLQQMINAGSLRIISNLDASGNPTQNSTLINSF